MSHPSQELIIEADQAEKQYWRDLWAYRELFLFLAWRDILVRYKQTVVGLAWALLRPFLTMIVFTVVFGRFAKLPSDGVPYPILVFAALLPWQFFSNALSESSNSLIGNERLITKVYFPRMIIPASSVITSLIDFFISFIILLALFIYYRYTPPAEIFAMPLFWIMAFAASFGPGLYLTALNVK